MAWLFWVVRVVAGFGLHITGLQIAMVGGAKVQFVIPMNRLAGHFLDHLPMNLDGQVGFDGRMIAVERNHFRQMREAGLRFTGAGPAPVEKFEGLTDLLRIGSV